MGEEGHVRPTAVRTAGARPGDDQPFCPDQEEVGHGGQGDGEDQADDDRRVVGDVEAVGDLLAQASEAYQRGDSDQPDDRRRGHAQAGEDIGQGEREVDLQ